MNGPKLISRHKLFSLYHSIALSPLSVSDKELAYYTQLARLDARLAEVVTEHIRDYWWKYEPRTLNRRLKAQSWPNAIRPMILQILDLCSASFQVRTSFGNWAAIVLAGISSGPDQLYFVPSLRPRSKSFDREVDESRDEFKVCGYYSRAILFNKQIPGELKDEQSAPMTTEARAKVEMYLKIRPHLNSTLKELEKELAMDRTTLSEIRSGKLQNIGLKRLAKLIDRLG